MFQQTNYSSSLGTSKHKPPKSPSYSAKTALRQIEHSEARSNLLYNGRRLKPSLEGGLYSTSSAFGDIRKIRTTKNSDHKSLEKENYPVKEVSSVGFQSTLTQERRKFVSKRMDPQLNMNDLNFKKNPNQYKQVVNTFSRLEKQLDSSKNQNENIKLEN